MTSLSCDSGRKRKGQLKKFRIYETHLAIKKPKNKGRSSILLTTSWEPVVRGKSRKNKKI